MAQPLRVGLLGYGAIARGVVRLLCAEDHVELVGALVADPARPRDAVAPRILASVAELLELRPDVVVEVAGHAALGCFGPPILRAGIDLLLVSVGALAERSVERALVEAASEGQSRAIVVSGAIGALDAIAAASVGGLTRVTHTTRKPGRALLSPSDAAELREPRELFRGSAR